MPLLLHFLPVRLELDDRQVPRGLAHYKVLHCMGKELVEQLGYMRLTDFADIARVEEHIVGQHIVEQHIVGQVAVVERRLLLVEHSFPVLDSFAEVCKLLLNEHFLRL